jgi:hypothetical protein
VNQSPGHGGRLHRLSVRHIRRSGRHRQADERRRVRRWLTLAGVASLLAVLIPLAAKGDTPPAGSNGSIGLIRNDVWLGFYQVPGVDEPVVCGHNGDGSWYPAGPYSAGQVVATSGDGAAVAWLLDQYAATTDPSTAAAIDAVNSRYGSNTGGLDDYNIAMANGLSGLIETLLTDGRDYAGPYTVSITDLVTSATGHFDTTYTAAIHVRSAAGNPVGGQVVTLAGHNAHLFASSVRTNRFGDATFQYSVPSSVSSPNFTIDASTTTPVLVRYSYLGPSAPHMSQDVVGSSTRPVKTTSAGAVNPYLSNLTFIKYTNGDSGKTPIAGAVFSVTDVTQGRLLGSITSQTTPVTLAGAKIMAGDTLRFVETTAPPGHYSQGPVTVTIPATATSGYQVEIPNPLTPILQLSTKVQAPLASETTVLTDQVTVAGDDGEDGVDTATLLGPVSPGTSGDGGPSLAGSVHRAGTAASECATISADQWATAPVVGTYIVPIDGSVGGGNGTFMVTGTSINRVDSGPGCYGWRHHLVLTPSGATSDSQPSEPGESTLVLQPIASTSISTSAATVGTYLSDTLYLSGTHGQPVQVTGQLQTTPAQRLGREMACPSPNTTAWSTVATIAAFTVTGDGTYPVPGRYLTSQAQCYSFAYQANVVLDPVASDPAAQSISLNLPAGDQGETAMISTPIVTTSSSATTTSPATTVADRIQIQGMQLPAGDSAVLRAYYLGTEPVLPTRGSNAGGPDCPNAAVLDRLPPEGRPSTAGCNTTGWENTPIAADPAPITVASDGTYTTDAITLPAQAGYGTWVESLTHNGITVELTSPGLPSETVHMTMPTIATAVVSTDPSGGTATMSDALDVSGLELQPGDRASITAHILTASSDGSSCDDIDWSVADHDSEPSRLDLPGDGHYITTPVSVGQGCHTYYEQLSINGRPVTTAAELPGQASETVLVAASAGPTPGPSATPTPTPSGSPGASPATSRPGNSQLRTGEGGRHSLAYTGNSVAIVGLLAGLALAAGGMLVLLTRSRR